MQKLRKIQERKPELRFHPKLSKKQMTDQSFKKSCDINNIVQQFAKTGRLPENTKIPQYGDFSETPTLESAFDVANAAKLAFQALPSDIRRLLDNDASQLENFIADEANNEICLKYGLKQKKVKPQETQKPTERVGHEDTNNSNSNSNGELNVTTSKKTI